MKFNLGFSHAAQTPIPQIDFYAKLNSLVWRAKSQFPVNAAYRASQAQRQVMFNDPRNSPSRSQFFQAYGVPYQQFGASNTWNTPSGQLSRGLSPQQSQPSVKFAGPQQVQIPTSVPWANQ